MIISNKPKNNSPNKSKTTTVKVWPLTITANLKTGILELSMYQSSTQENAHKLQGKQKDLHNCRGICSEKISIQLPAATVVMAPSCPTMTSRSRCSSGNFRRSSASRCFLMWSNYIYTTATGYDRYHQWPTLHKSPAKIFASGNKQLRGQIYTDVKPNLLFAVLQQFFNLLALHVSKWTMSTVIFQ